MNAEIKTCQNCKASFTIEPEDFDFYAKMKVPPPTFCPECRAIRRMMFWNQSNLYRAKDTRTGKEIFSTYPEQSKIKIYDHDHWWSDAWDPMEYGRPVDFSRPFLEQLQELNLAVPVPNKSVRGMINSEYCNQASYQKDCYLCFNGGNSENCLYCIGFQRLKDTMDVCAAFNLELCYEIYQGENCSQCFFSSDVINCRDVWFSRDCIDCSDCFGCVNLRHKKYCIFNVQYDKENYQKKLKEFDKGSYRALANIKETFAKLYYTAPHKYIHGIQNANVSGDYVYHSKNAHDVFEADGLENVRYSENFAPTVKDSYDYTNWGENSELVYESVSCGDNCRNIKFCFDCWPAVEDTEYSLGCHSSSDLFGCVGLSKKKYCILNVAYSKEEYFALREKIIKQMKEMPYVDAGGRIYSYGEFLPSQFSPLAYNETIAIDYYPKTKTEAEAAGYVWRDPDPREYKTTMNASDIPDHIKDVQDGITKEIIQCSHCGKAYRILDQELLFYRRFAIPAPRHCHQCRYLRRLVIRNPRKLYDRRCQCHGKTQASPDHESHPTGTQCPNKFRTSYAPDRKEIIYCESCYNAEVA